jgi:transcriptional regulator with XRE-family HTH domain
MMSKLHERLKVARKLKGITQDQLSKRVNISRAAISQYESSNPGVRTTPTAANLKKLAEALGVTLSWLADDDSSIDPRSTQGMNIREYPAVHDATDREAKRDIVFSRKWLAQYVEDPDTVVEVRVSGQDLTPRIQDGDIVLIVPCNADAIENGRVYAIKVGDRVILRRAFIGIDGLELRDNHGNIDELTPQKMKKLAVIGRVFWVGGEV